MAEVVVTFREGDTGLLKADLSLDVCKAMSTGNAIVSENWSIKCEYGLGVYRLLIPEATTSVFVAVTNNKNPLDTVTYIGTSGDGTVTLDEIEELLTDHATTAAAIRQEIDNYSTQLAAIVADTNELQSKFAIMAPNNKYTAVSHEDTLPIVVGGIGVGNVMFTWTEYERGHAGEAEFAVSGVVVAVYNNETATGDPQASAVTDETGRAVMWLDEGTYYLFRRKAGRAFDNPIRVVVSHTEGDSVEEDALLEDYIQFDWYEYESGHVGEPEYVIADVDVRVYDNIGGTGDPVNTGRTDASGHVLMWLPAGTFFLFRTKVGRVFSNPVEITVG